MTDMLALHGWSHPTLMPTSSNTFRPSHSRSASSGPRAPSPSKTISKARSSNALADMSSRSVSSSKFEGPSENSLNTLRDPRVASTSELERMRSPSSQHPDLSNEVAALSNKLINAINNQTTLDDTLAETRQELDSSRRKIQELEAEAKKREEEIANGELVRWADVEEDQNKLEAMLAEERKQRGVIEKEKKNIEQELENLTAALFEEANKMVSAAKKEREAVERRNEQLKTQVHDTEMLLASHQEQLAELKMVMQQLSVDRDETDTRTNTSTTPSSPAQIQPQDNINRLMGAMNLSPATPGSGDISPGPSTSFSHLLKTVCRTDMQAYDDFHALVQLPKNSCPPSRVASGSYSGLNVMGLAGLTGNSSSQNNGVTNGSTASLSGPAALNSSPSGSSPMKETSSVPLKETRFYKRALTEDIEPTLRLDAAPGISWLTRRTVLGSICEGNLVVEPMPSSSRKHAFPCSLCGERRIGNENCRTHRFRTSDSETAARYPLCMLCLEKVRSCCEFVGYLRLIKEGHIHTDDPEEEKEAWEETVRLRERMFWSRVGGGVIPAFIQSKDSDKMSSTMDSPEPKVVRDSTEQELPPVPVAEAPSEDQKQLQVEEDPFKSDAKRVSIGSTVMSRKETQDTRVQTPEPTSRSLSPNPGMDSDSDCGQKSEVKAQLKNNLWDVLRNGSPSSKTASPSGKSTLSERERDSRPVTPSRVGPNGEARPLKVKIPAVFGGPG
ncbi:rab guanine nucleotide exchange factor S2 [Arachnomyces sp. PD_36]|nr:rab guanine nucleotide exchange factor S2 [Arachnomyces sp. PD_36]